MIKKIIKAVNVVFGNFVRVQSRLSFDKARKYLQEISPKPKGTCYTKNKLAIQYDLHILKLKLQEHHVHQVMHEHELP